METGDSLTPRIEKVKYLISSCRLGIHDLSNVEVDIGNELPRFNMPFELGIFIGAATFGTGRHRSKRVLILEREKYRFQKFISDIAGQDIRTHEGREYQIIKCVRDWLDEDSEENGLAGATMILKRYTAFKESLPAICERAGMLPTELTLPDFRKLVKAWTATTSSS